MWISAFSALTFLRAAKDLPAWRFAIYTDRPSVFQRFGIDADFIQLSELGDAIPEYHFRMKITAMQHAADRFAGNLLFVDGDTYFTAPPMEQIRALAEGHAVMHVRDCRLGSEHSAAVIDLEKLDAAGITSQRLPRLDGWPEWIWNSGVLGIGETHRHLIPEALAVCDEIYAKTGSHISEQMAWTLVLSQVCSIVDAEQVVHHYWDSKEQLMYEIVAFLRRARNVTPTELAERAYDLTPRATENWRPPAAVRARIAARDGRRLLRAAPERWLRRSVSRTRKLRPSGN